MKKAVFGIVLAVLAMAPMAWGKTVGIYKDLRSGITEGMLKTLDQAGWKTVIISNQTELASEEKLGGLDVLFLPGGWNAAPMSFKARRSMVAFAAGGKGILAGAFRSGYVRSMNRPLFPQVGATDNRVNGPAVSGAGDSELARAISQPFNGGGWDHCVIKVGPAGKIFAKSGNDPVGVYGEVYGGRYLAFGTFIGGDAKTEPMQGSARQTLLAMLDWLAAAPKPGETGKAQYQAQADLDFLRQDKRWDWTLDERGPDRGPGVLPQLRNWKAVPLESRAYTLAYLAQVAADRKPASCQAAETALQKAVKELDDNYRKILDRKIAELNAMTPDQLTADNPAANPSNVMALIAATPGKTEEEKKALSARVKGGQADAKQVIAFLHADRLSEQLFPAEKLNALTAQADKAIAEWKPAVREAQAKAIALERKADLEAVPALIARCASADAAVRREAALELGRIGSPKAAPALIGLLKDADEKTRINAILGLGWMQAKAAVDPLIELAKGDDLFMKRRALQALGQIGDGRAVDVLLANVKGRDYFVRENAILGLGWLKAKAAVPELLTIVTTFDRQDADQRGLMMSAIRALGHIGDPSVVAALEDLAAKANDFPLQRGGRGEVVNLYGTPKTFGLTGYARLAIAEIKAGGRSETGIAQSEFLADKERFYGVTRRFNAWAGRPFPTLESNFKGDSKALMAYLWDAGWTGVHLAWGEERMAVEDYMAVLKAADEFGLRCVSVLPLDGYAHSMGSEKTFYDNQRSNSRVEKNSAETVLFKFRDEPAFSGFWSEEVYPHPGLTADEFGAWLTRKYGADFRHKLGLTADQNLLGMTGTNYLSYRGPLKTEYMQCCADKLLDDWRETQEWLHGLRKGCAFTWSESENDTALYPGEVGRAGGVIDSCGPESYQSFGRVNSLVMEMFKDGEARPVMSEFYNWYGVSPATDVRGFAQHLMHGECFYNFALNHVFGQAPTYDLWSWDPTRWANVRKIFRKARVIRDYLSVPESAANVALLLSEQSCVSLYQPKPGWEGWFNRWYQNQAGLWTALNQSQIPADVIWAETLTAAKLNRYRVVVLSNAEIVTDRQANLLRDWVRDGGVLIAGGGVSRFDSWAEPQKNYRLAELFGADYEGLAVATDPSKADTYFLLHAKPLIETSTDPDQFRLFVHRAFKPSQSLVTYAFSDKESASLPGIAPGTSCEYDLPLGYDKVKPTSAEVLASFAGGDPALTVNRVGKGLCYLWTPDYPGLCHVASDWEMQANRYDFWPNVRELLAAMVRGGLANQGATLPVDVAGVSKEVEVTVRQQPELNRMMVHLLDYDTRSTEVKGAGLTVHAPAGKTVKRIWYPDTGTELKATAGEVGVTAKLRDFEVHDMVVIEWETVP